MRSRRSLAVAALAGAVATAGCTGGDEAANRAQIATDARLGQPVRLADCEGWQDAGARERYGTVEALRRFAGDRSGSPGGRGATLDDSDAHDLFDRACAEPYARAFKLYKLYTRAAAFASLRGAG